MGTTNYVGLAVGAVGIFLVFYGERLSARYAARRLRRHTCPTPCEESRRCLCGCGGLHSVGERQEKCAVCGAVIVYSDMEITDEMPAPRGFTSWGWDRDREFRKSRWTGKDRHG